MQSAKQNKDTGVVLGFVEEADAWQLRSSQFPSKVGGRPAWLSQSDLPALSDLTCPKCQLPTAFLLQVYAPITSHESSFHRTLFIFCCKTPTCHSRNDWHCFKGKVGWMLSLFGFQQLSASSSASPFSQKSLMSVIEDIYCPRALGLSHKGVDKCEGTVYLKNTITGMGNVCLPKVLDLCFRQCSFATFCECTVFFTSMLQCSEVSCQGKMTFTRMTHHWMRRLKRTASTRS